MATKTRSKSFIAPARFSPTEPPRIFGFNFPLDNRVSGHNLYPDSSKNSAKIGHIRSKNDQKVAEDFPDDAERSVNKSRKIKSLHRRLSEHGRSLLRRAFSLPEANQMVPQVVDLRQFQANKGEMSNTEVYGDYAYKGYGKTQESYGKYGQNRVLKYDPDVGRVRDNGVGRNNGNTGNHGNVKARTNRSNLFGILEEDSESDSDSGTESETSLTMSELEDRSRDVGTGSSKPRRLEQPKRSNEMKPNLIRDDSEKMRTLRERKQSLVDWHHGFLDSSINRKNEWQVQKKTLKHRKPRKDASHSNKSDKSDIEVYNRNMLKGRVNALKNNDSIDSFETYESIDDLQWMEFDVAQTRSWGNSRKSFQHKAAQQRGYAIDKRNQQRGKA